MIGERERVAIETTTAPSFAPAQKKSKSSVPLPADRALSGEWPTGLQFRFDEISIFPGDAFRQMGQETLGQSEPLEDTKQTGQAERQGATGSVKTTPTSKNLLEGGAELPQLVTELPTEGLIEALTANDEITKLVGKALIQEFDAARTPVARKKAAKEILAFYAGLEERETNGDRALEAYRASVFTPEKRMVWHSAAAYRGSSKAKEVSKAAPASESAEQPLPKPTHAADGGRWVLGTALEPQAEADAPSWAPQVKTPATQQGIKLAKSVTLRQALGAIREGMDINPEIVGGKQLSANLFDCTKMIVFATQQLYFLDRSRFINFDAMNQMGLYFATLRQTLPPGTYFVMEQSLASSKSQLSGSARPLLQLDKGVSVWQGSDFALGTDAQHAKAERMFGEILNAKSGILVVVPESNPGMDMTQNLAISLERAVYYLGWAIRKVISDMNALDVVVDAALEEGIEQLSRFAPVVGQALMTADMFDRVVWFGTAVETAVQAQSEDELDIAAQAIAYGVAQSVVEEMTEKGIELGGKGIGKVAGSKKGTADTAAANAVASSHDIPELSDDDFESELDEADFEEITPVTTPSAQNAPNSSQSATITGTKNYKPIPDSIQKILDKGELATQEETDQVSQYLGENYATLAPEDGATFVKFLQTPKKKFFTDAAQAKQAAKKGLGKTSFEEFDAAFTYDPDANELVSGKMILADLGKKNSAEHKQVAELLPKLWARLHDTDFMSALLSDIWADAQSISPDRIAGEGYSALSLAMLDMILARGGQTVVVDKLLSDAEFKAQVLDTGLYLIDKNFAGGPHSMTIHLLHGLAVDRALAELNHSWRYGDFVLALGRLQGTELSYLGNKVWAILFDTLGDEMSMHRPETLAPRIKSVFFDFE